MWSELKSIWVERQREGNKARINTYIAQQKKLKLGIGEVTSEVKQILKEQTVAARVVSMPSWELFEKQDATYKEKIFPKAIRKRLAVEAGSSLGCSLSEKAKVRGDKTPRDCTIGLPRRVPRVDYKFHLWHRDRVA